MILRVLKSLFSVLISLFILSAIGFVCLRTLPGNPYSNDDVEISEMVKKSMQLHYGVGQGVVSDFFTYMGRLLQFDLGPSLANPGVSAASLIGSALEMTLRLGLFSLALVILLSLIFMFLEHFISSFSFDLITTSIVSLPHLLIGPVSIWYFGFYLNWAKTNGASEFKDYLLPAFVVAIKPAAILARIFTREIRQNKKLPFVQTLRAFGFSENQILFQKISKLSLNGYISYLSQIVIHLITGSFIVEILFSIHGIGFLFYNSIQSRDYFVVLDLILLSGFVVIFSQKLVDLVLTMIDPRQRGTQ